MWQKHENAFPFMLSLCCEPISNLSIVAHKDVVMILNLSFDKCRKHKQLLHDSLENKWGRVAHRPCCESTDNTEVQFVQKEAQPQQNNKVSPLFSLVFVWLNELQGFDCEETQNFTHLSNVGCFQSKCVLEAIMRDENVSFFTNMFPQIHKYASQESLKHLQMI